MRKTQEQYEKEVAVKHGGRISVTGKYTTAKTKVELTCNVCGNCWEAKAVSIISGTGCPACAGVPRKDTEYFKAELQKKGITDITVIGEYIRAHSPIAVRCCNCRHEWSPSANSLRGGRGCPECATGKRKESRESAKQKI